MPDHHCQLSRGCDGRRGRTPISLDPLKERLQRTWRRLRGPRRLDKHLVGVRVSLLGEEFDAPFARLDWISPDRFDIQWHRYTGEWFRLHRGLNLVKAIETLGSDGILHPV
jgi:hypothetical protein